MGLFDCFLGVFRSSIELPHPLTLDGSPIDTFFRSLGLDAAGRPLVDLRFDTSRPEAAHSKPANGGTTAHALHRSLARLTRRSASRPGPRRRIGVIFADAWDAEPDVFGVMFDAGFVDPALGSNLQFSAVPREGCAVFLEAIRQHRDLADRHRQTLWTTIHELGHVFNLWHLGEPVRFMTQSSSAGVYDPGNPLIGEDGQPLDIQNAFAADHVAFLDSCLSAGQSGPRADFAWPGGKAFGTRGTEGPAERNFRDGLVLPRSRSALELRLSLHQEEMWAFEPVELDIELRPPRSIAKTYRLPSHVDPGYATFSIWIEEPDGGRFRYRSPRIYCENPGRLLVSAKRPFSRDLSIFAQSGGYTFRKAGPHTLFATWVLPNGRVLESNRVEVLLKSRMDAPREHDELWQVLGRRETAALLYHRCGPPRSRVLEPLEEWVARVRDPDLEVNVRYALGRFYERAGAGRAASTRRRYDRLARRHLDEALQKLPHLSRRRRHHCERLVDEITQRRAG